jgi:hypothetical protein
MRDLFGEIPVTLDELLAWMLAVPGIPPTTRRFAYYVRGWNVIEKIRAAKVAGTFDEIVSARDTPAPHRLASALQAAAAARQGFAQRAARRG